MPRNESTYKINVDVSQAIQDLEKASSSFKKLKSELNEFNNASTRRPVYIADLANSLNLLFSQKLINNMDKSISKFNDLNNTLTSITKLKSALQATLQATSSASDLTETLNKIERLNTKMKSLNLSMRYREVKGAIGELWAQSGLRPADDTSIFGAATSISRRDASIEQRETKYRTQIELLKQYQRASEITQSPRLQAQYSAEIAKLTASLNNLSSQVPSVQDAMKKQKEAYEKSASDIKEKSAETTARTQFDRLRRFQRTGLLQGINEGFDTRVEDLRSQQDIAKKYLKRYSELAAKSDRTTEEETEFRGLAKNIGIFQTDFDTAGAGLKKVGLAQGIVNATASIAKTIISAAKSAANYFKEITGISLSIKDNFKDILSGVADMANTRTGMATFGQGTTLVTNQAARNLQLKYGLSSASTYGLSEAMGMLNIQSDTDIAYMNKQQQELFVEYMNRASSWYTEMQTSGVLTDIQELQLDFAMYKKEMSAEFLKWIGANKETILGVATGILDVTKWIFNILSKLLGTDTSKTVYSASGISLGSPSKKYEITTKADIHIDGGAEINTEKLAGLIKDMTTSEIIDAIVGVGG